MCLLFRSATASTSISSKRSCDQLRDHHHQKKKELPDWITSYEDKRAEKERLNNIQVSRYR